ncbi:hypothetical protein CPB86DRAFT_818750 [Serendipita vermifera]|nr:hypothetical protein CPB86DRAFT_818750 [Serendipita vermifera]
MHLIPKPPYVGYENLEEAKELETQRLDLLDQIQQCKRAKDYEGPSLRELQKKYNRLVEKLDKLERGSELLKGLEHHHWMRIVQMVPLVMFDTDALPGTRPNPIDDVLSLCLVHKTWRKWIYKEPEMWNRLVFDRRFTTSSDWAKVEIALQLSGNQPIHMRSVLWIHQWDVFYEILRRVADRLETLDIDIGDTWSRRKEYSHDYLVAFVKEIPPLPSLKELVCPATRGWPLIFNELARKVPKLRYIKGISLTLDAFKPGYTHTRPVSSGHSPLEEHFLLEVQRSLRFQNLKMPEARFHSYHDENEATSLIHDFPLSRTQNLTLRRQGIRLIADVPGRFVGLKSLTIDSYMAWLDMRELFRRLSMMPNLRLLAVRLDYMTKEIAWSNCEPCNLTSLHINVLDPFKQDDKKHLKEVGEDRIQQLFEAIARFMPYIDELRFDKNGKWVPRALWDVIPRFKYLHDFIFKGYGFDDVLYNWENARISSETLAHLIITGEHTDLQPVITQLDCPNLKHADIDARTYSDDAWRLKTGGKLAGVPVITWRGKVVGLPLESLDNLTKLEFGGLRETSYEFFTSLIYNPGYCPSLSQVTFRDPPLWDLLFILLEKRNFLPSGAGVVPIRSIGVPRATPYAMIRDLVDLLRGKYGRRPANSDISVEGISKLYFDSYVSGCDLCLRSLRSCSKDVKFNNSRIPREHSDEYYKGQGTNRREDDDDDRWMSDLLLRWETWLERLEEWGGLCKRTEPCDAWEHRQTSIIHYDYFIGSNTNAYDDAFPLRPARRPRRRAATAKEKKK